jgi:hypothetical protein
LVIENLPLSGFSNYPITKLPNYKIVWLFARRGLRGGSIALSGAMEPGMVALETRGVDGK